MPLPSFEKTPPVQAGKHPHLGSSANWLPPVRRTGFSGSRLPLFMTVRRQQFSGYTGTGAIMLIFNGFFKVK